jgi:hypothetical protein
VWIRRPPGESTAPALSATRRTIGVKIADTTTEIANAAKALFMSA